MSDFTLKDVISNHIDKIDEQLFGLTDYHIKAVHYFLKNILGLQHYNIHIDTNNKLLIIQPTDHTGKNVKIPTDDIHIENVENFLTMKLNTKGRVKFYEK